VTIMSVRRAEFPLLENLMDTILAFNKIEQKKIREYEKRVQIARRMSGGDEEKFEELKSMIDLSSLIDHDVDFAGVNPEVKKILLNPKNRPVLLAASHTKDHLRQKRLKRMEKPAEYTKKKIKNIKDRTKSDFGKTMCDIAWMGIKAKFGL